MPTNQPTNQPTKKNDETEFRKNELKYEKSFCPTLYIRGLIFGHFSYYLSDMQQ